jgi:hypothetical protein
VLNDGYRCAQPILRKAVARKQVLARVFGMTAKSVAASAAPEKAKKAERLDPGLRRGDGKKSTIIF